MPMLCTFHEIVFSSAFKNSYFIIVYVYVYICHMYAAAPQGSEKELGLLEVMSSLMWVPGFELGSCGKVRTQFALLFCF